MLAFVAGGFVGPRERENHKEIGKGIFFSFFLSLLAGALTKTAPLYNAINYELYQSWKVINVFEGEFITEV